MKQCVMSVHVTAPAAIGHEKDVDVVVEEVHETGVHTNFTAAGASKVLTPAIKSLHLVYNIPFQWLLKGVK